MDIEKNSQYQWEHDYLLRQISNICQNCTDPRKRQATMDYQDPMKCTCRCKYIRIIRARIEEISTVLVKDNKTSQTRVAVIRRF